MRRGITVLLSVDVVYSPFHPVGPKNVTVVSKNNVYVLFFFGEEMKSEVAGPSVAAVNIGH
jgi:hypothetical protein